jgi:acetate kinase
MAGQGSSTDGLIFVINSGSSSLKFGVYRRGTNGDEEAILTGSADGIGQPSGGLKVLSASGRTLIERQHVVETQNKALVTVAETIRTEIPAEPVAVGHRIVHGGPQLLSHQAITPEVLEKLNAAVHFAPIHIPKSLSLIATAQDCFPSAPQFACFDHVFHRTMPQVASRFALPRRYGDEGVFRYGFHGLSYESLVHHFGETLPARAIFAHLGNGASLCALRDGVSVDTTMGLTPTGGIPMSTRSGDLDPGVLIYLMRTKNFGADAIENLVNRESGLFGLSDGESSVARLEALARAGNEPSKLALEIFVISVRKVIGAYAALLGGVDLLVFTGGIGEHSEYIRTQATKGLEFLGLSPNKIKNLPAEEELQIARHCRRML